MKQKSLLASFLLLKGFTYPQFAARIGVSARTISYWSDGIFFPKAKYVKKIESALGVRIIKVFPNLFNRHYNEKK